MKQLKQFDVLILHDFEETSFHLPRHSHTYYEIIYIYSGSGFHELNTSVLPYCAGDVFFIAPGDHHYFDIKESTRFGFVKFTDNYFHKYSSDGIVLHTPQTIMQQKRLKECKITLSTRESTVLRGVMDNIFMYNEEENISNSPFVFYQILSVLGLIREAFVKGDQSSSLQLSSPLDEQVISYIHQHIYSPEMLEVKSIAEHFSIAPAYFSTYFKKHYGESYRNYLNKYKVSLIKNRLKANQGTLKEIADEFGFTDDAHLSHFFKNQTSLSPKTFKQKLAFGDGKTILEK